MSGVLNRGCRLAASPGPQARHLFGNHRQRQVQHLEGAIGLFGEHDRLALHIGFDGSKRSLAELSQRDRIEPDDYGAQRQGADEQRYIGTPVLVDQRANEDAMRHGGRYRSWWSASRSRLAKLACPTGHLAHNRYRSPKPALGRFLSFECWLTRG